VFESKLNKCNFASSSSRVYQTAVEFPVGICQSVTDADTAGAHISNTSVKLAMYAQCSRIAGRALSVVLL
jgi:hypothetical protein